jgi:hypothetical protein
MRLPIQSLGQQRSVNAQSLRTKIPRTLLFLLKKSRTFYLNLRHPKTAVTIIIAIIIAMVIAMVIAIIKISVARPIIGLPGTFVKGAV